MSLYDIVQVDEQEGQVKCFPRPWLRKFRPGDDVPKPSYFGDLDWDPSFSIAMHEGGFVNVRAGELEDWTDRPRYSAVIDKWGELLQDEDVEAYINRLPQKKDRMSLAQDHMDLIGCTNALKWAQVFVRTVQEYPGIATDEGTMVGWFANALMAGEDAGVAKEKRRGFDEKITELVFLAAGAATAPLMQDHPHYEFPSEEVSKVVREVLENHGVHIPVGYRG